MDLRTLGTLLSIVYVVLRHGVKQGGAQPTPALAQKVLDTPFHDVEKDGTVYDVRTFLRQHAAGLNRAQQLNLVQACLHELHEHPLATGEALRTVPQRLRPFARR